VRGNPIAKVGALLIACRIAGLAERYLVQPGGSLADRLALFLPAAASHAGALVIIVAVCWLVAEAWPASRRGVVIVACATFALLMIAGQADFTVSSITGAPLTPTVFRTFRGLHVVRSNEFLEPLRAHWAVTSAGAATFGGLLCWIVLAVRRDGREVRAGRSSLRPGGVGLAAGVGLAGLAMLPSWPVPPPPVEVAFAREYLGLDATTLSGSEADAIRELRSVVGLGAGAAWVSDEYPLVYRPTPDARAAARRQDPPDIVVVMIESLRAAELGFVTGAGESVTPNLDRLAARSVVFPTFISNGFPSAPAVLAFHCAAWPHRRKEIMTDFSDRRFDCMPGRLRGTGYDTIYVGADPHFDHQDVWLPRWYARVVDLVAEGVPATDRNIVSRVIAETRRHDETRPRAPLFAFVSTYSTHYPFTLPSDADAGSAGSAADLETAYRRTLNYTDREVGRLLEFLGARPRRTVTIVVGDHGFYTDLRRTSGLPENDNVWTAALIAGPEDLVGPPRRVVMPASHVDMLPTVMAIVGDVRPSAALGDNLLGPPRNGVRTALAIRPGGVRFDRDGYSTMVDARTPNIAVTRALFPHRGPSAEPPTGPEASAARLAGWVNDWSYLVEHNRLWSDALLSR
jgi:arylsulfatase A-like enzyme